MRVPVAVSLQSRDGTVTKDARVTNSIIEKNGQDLSLRSRPGNQDFGLTNVGQAQLLYPWNGIKSITGDSFNAQYTPTTTAITAATRSTTWNPADKDADVTLSGGNLAATIAGAPIGGVRSVTNISSGQWYWEVTITAVGGGCQIGVANSSKNLTTSNIQNGVIYTNTGTIQTQTSSFAVTTYTTGDVIGMFLDANVPAISFYKNNVLVGTVSGAGYFPVGNLYAFVFCIGPTITLTANFAGAFTYTPGALVTALALNAAGSQFSAANTIDNIATPLLFFKNAEFGWTVNRAGAITKVADVDYPGNLATPIYTAPGAVYLDGYFLVLGNNGVIYNSDINDPTSWPALGTIVAQSVYGNGKALFRSQNYVVVFKDYSTEPFYNAANATGSPLTRVDNGFTLVGCVNGLSVVQINGKLIWVSQSAQRGRAIHIMDGLDQQPISTPDIERILNADQLANIYAYSMRLDGHNLYVLTLIASNITIVYDLNSGTWSQWTSLTIGNSVSVTSITRSGTTATVVTSGAHGISDGDPVTISGAVQSQYNGIFQTQYISITSFSYQVTGSPATPSTGTILVYPYTESYFKYSHYANYNGYDLLLHESNGHIYQVLNTLYRDAGAPINVDGRSIKLDGERLTDKSMNRMAVVANTISESMMLRYTDDDYASYSLFRIVDLSTKRPNIRRLGSFRRRAFNIRYTGNNQLQLSSLELGVD